MGTSDQNLARVATMPENDRYQHYEVLKRADGSLWELGRGAMGVTYKAYDADLRRAVALKVITTVYLESDTARRRFLREARAAAAFRHQNIASVFHLGMEHGNYFYAMEFIDGQTVDEYMQQKGKLAPLDALDIGVQVTRALAASAKQGLVHRDLKPANLMLVDEEGEKVVKVIDFGLAKTLKRQNNLESRSLTMAGSFIGTPHFASPEQLEESDVDGRSDIYSLGAILYYLVTGCPPFSGSVAQIMSQHLYKPVPAERLQGFSSSFVYLILSMMEKDRGKRPQSAAELRQAIQHCVRQLRKTKASPLGVTKAVQQTDTAAPITLTQRSERTVLVGSVFAGKYRVDQNLPDIPAGKCYRGVDLRRELKVSLLVLSREYMADVQRATTLEEAVKRITNASHPGLREILAFERNASQTVLVEGFVSAPSLREILRTRELLSPVEVVAALERLAPIADYAWLNRLEHVDFTLDGIQLFDPTQGQDTADLGGQVKTPLTKWSDLTPRVAPIDFSFKSDTLLRLAGSATVLEPSISLSRSRDSYVRKLCLLAYELLGGVRSGVETRGRYTPVAALSEEGNQVLRRGLVDEINTAGELVHSLSRCLTGRSAVRLVSSAPAHQSLITGKEPLAIERHGESAGKPRTPGTFAIMPQELLLFGTLLAQHYRPIEKLDDFSHGWKFLADDLGQMHRRISLLVLSHEFVSDILRFAALEEAVEQLRIAPHPMLQKIYSLETLIDRSFLVEEYVAGPSLLDVFRTRGLFSALEVVRLINLLATLADHASAHRLRHVDLTLRGVRLENPESTGSEISTKFLPRSLSDWQHLEPKVGAINFSLLPFYSDSGSGEEIRIQKVAGDSVSPGHYVRLLSLLAYELLGGTRRRVETTGQYTSIAALTEEGNGILRRGSGGDYASAGELARGLVAAVDLEGSIKRIYEIPKYAIPKYAISKTSPKVRTIASFR